MTPSGTSASSGRGPSQNDRVLAALRRGPVNPITERLYDKGWRSARVCRGGALVGEITENPDGKRVWWADR